MLGVNRETVEAERALQERNLLYETFGRALFTTDLLTNKQKKFKKIQQSTHALDESDPDTDEENMFDQQFDHLLDM